MPETLEAEVNLATQQAFQNLQQLVQVLEVAKNSLDKLSSAVDQSEEETKKLAKRTEELREQMGLTGAVADRTKFEESRKALQDSTMKTEKLKTELGKMRGELGEVAIQQVKTAAETVRSNQQMADKTKETTSAVGDLTGMFVKLGGTLFGLQKIVEVIKEMEQHTKNVIEAQVKLGNIKIGIDEKIQNVIDNLGFMPGTQGQERARKLVQAVQSRAGGLSADVASELIAKAQATGFEVARADRPDLDRKLVGFDMASQVGLFAQRTRLDPQTAGLLFNMAQIAGVKGTGDMEKMLATLETQFQQISITDPRQGMMTAVRAAAGRMMQGVSMQQAVASVAAAAVGEPSPERAATNIEQFTRMAFGTDDTRRLTLAKLAQQQGMISPQAMQAATDKVRPTITTDFTDEIRRAHESIAQRVNEMQKLDREGAEFDRDKEEKQKRLTFELADTAEKIKSARTPQQQTELQEKQRRTMADWEDLQRSAAAKLQDREQHRTQLQTQNAETEQRILEMQKKDTQKLTDKALTEAFSQIPLAQREQLIWNVTRNMNQVQLGSFIQGIAEGDVAQSVIRMMGPAGRAAYDRALAAGQRPDVAAFQQRNAAFRTGSVGQAAAAAVAAETGQAAAMTPGQLFTNNALTLADADIVALRGRGAGQTGNWAQTKLDLLPEGALGRQGRLEMAGTEEGLRAVRLMLVTRSIFERFLITMSPAHRKRRSGRIDEVWVKFRDAYYVITAGYEGVVLSGADKLRRAQEVSSEIGAFIEFMQREAIQLGENPGQGGTEGLALPANQPAQTVTDVPQAPPLSPPPTGVGGSQRGGTGAGGALGPPASGGVPTAAGAAGGPVTYNLSIGTVVSGVLDQLEDLPSRVGAPDLA